LEPLPDHCDQPASWHPAAEAINPSKANRHT